MKWYWESSHYKKETGDLILSKILNKKPNVNRDQVIDFGQKLSSSTIESHLENIRKNRQLFQEQYPEIVNEVSQMITKTDLLRLKLIRKHSHLEPIEFFKNNTLPSN